MLKLRRHSVVRPGERAIKSVASFESELRQILEDLGIQNRIIIEKS